MAARPPGAKGDPPQEIELKLLLDPSAVDRVLGFAGFERRALGRATQRQLHSIYYDTSDLALLAGGLALRVRRVGSRIVQTLKGRAGASAGLFARLEVESEISSPGPDLAAIPHGPLRAQVEQLVDGRELEPVLDTEVQRTTLRLREGSSLIDADLDVGEIRTSGGTLPICELELELVEGDAAALYRLALELAREVPLHLAIDSKFDRGLALLTGARSSPVHARIPQIDGAAPLELGLAAILTSGLEQILANEAVAYEGVDAGGVHQMRVGVRRLRSALGLFRPLLPRERCEAFRKELRDLASALGGVRDLDVFLDGVLRPIRARTGDLGSLAELCSEAERLRDERYAELRSRLDSERFGQLMLELGGWIAARGWREQPLSPESANLFQPARATAGRMLERRHRRVRRHGQKLESACEERRHQLRIQIKQLRYASEFLGGAFPDRRSRAYAKRAAQAQDALGRLNDLVQARELLSVLADRIGLDEKGAVASAAGFVLGWAARDADDALEAVASSWRRLRNSDPFWR
jgi:inorganic triphosphatase YgiF